jgi:hypothetical protein
MRFKLWVAILAAVLSPGPALGAAEECPAKSAAMDDIIASISDSPSCERAMKTFDACQFGSSGDVQFGDAVEKKCERDFLAELKAPQKRAYQRRMRACDRKYRNQSGTMYLSFAAFCRAKVARLYSQQALKAAATRPSR